MPTARAVLAVASGCLALFTIVFAAINPDAVVYPIVDPPALIGGLFAFGMGLSNRRLEWSSNKRSLAVAIASIWAFAAVLAFPLTLVYPACACPSDDTTHDVAIVAILAAPALLFLAAALPSRMIRAR